MLDNGVLTSAGFGGLIGLVISYIFKIKTKSSVDKFTKEFTGESHIKFINHLVMAFATMGFVIMAAVGLIVKDLDFVKREPMNFLGETVVASFLPAVVIVFAAWSRSYPLNMGTFKMFMLFAIKCGLLHLLFQITGYYTYLFGAVAG